MSKTYQQALMALRVTQLGDAPLDINGQLCSKSGRKQAIMLLKGENNPDPKKYEVFGTFRAGEDVDGFKTIVENNKLCVPDVYEFEVDRTSLSYGVSRDGLGFSFNDTLQVSSSVNASYIGYSVTSAPAWLTATLGTTTGVVNTLNLVVDRNRTDDDDRSGKIVLTQNETGVTRTITVTQKGRLTEGTPTEYPYINEDTILGKMYPVVQMGEQVWIQSPLVDGHSLNQNAIDVWYSENKNLYKPTVEEFSLAFGSGWTRVNKNDRQILLEKGALEDGSDGVNIRKHMIPTQEDLHEMIAFMMSNTGATSWENFTNTARGSSLAKKELNTSIDGYDDVRKSYPKNWIKALNDGLLTDDHIKTGSDNYALSFLTTGIAHAFNNAQTAEDIPLYGSWEIHTRGSDPHNTNAVMLYTYSHNSDITKRGIFRRGDDLSAFSGRPIRTVRYRKLPYDVYHNGESIIKINTGNPVPEGYELLPKGATRGFWFGNNNLSYDTIKEMEGWLVNAFLGNPNNKIG